MGRAIYRASGAFLILLALAGVATVTAVEWEAVAEQECDGRQCVEGGGVCMRPARYVSPTGDLVEDLAEPVLCFNSSRLQDPCHQGSGGGGRFGTDVTSESMDWFESVFTQRAFNYFTASTLCVHLMLDVVFLVYLRGISRGKARARGYWASIQAGGARLSQRLRRRQGRGDYAAAGAPAVNDAVADDGARVGVFEDVAI